MVLESPKHREKPKHKSILLAKPLNETAPKIAKSSLGNIISDANERANDPKLKEKIKKRKKRKKDDKPSPEDQIEEIKDNLASSATKIEGSDKSGITINLNLSKIPKDKKGKNLFGINELFDPSVKAFTINIDTKDSTNKNLKIKRDVTRENINGKIVYCYKDENGKKIPLEIPDNGKASIKINPNQLENYSRQEAISKMRTETATRLKKTTQEAKKKLTNARGTLKTTYTKRSTQIRRRNIPSLSPKLTTNTKPQSNRTTPKKSTKYLSKYLSKGQKTFEKYLSNFQEILEKLNPAQISKIPYTPRTEKIPEKPAGAIRLVVFGDSDSKSVIKDGTDQVNLLALQKKIPEWKTDFVIGVGDHIRANNKYKINPNTYEKRLKIVLKEFENFGTTPYAIAAGNHDINGKKGNTNIFRANFEKNLDKNFKYESIGQEAFSYQIANATFVVFDEGNTKITARQIAFFEKKCKESKGAVYLINHIPPFQHSYGPGLTRKHENLNNYDKIQKIARENVESKGQPFYVLSGHDHFHHVIGNFLNPGGTGANYRAFPQHKKNYKSTRSAAVIDMDKSGKILAVYFRDAQTGFNSPLKDHHHKLTWGSKPKRAIASTTPDMKPPETANDIDQEIIKAIMNFLFIPNLILSLGSSTISKNEFRATLAGLFKLKNKKAKLVASGRSTKNTRKLINPKTGRPHTEASIQARIFEKMGIKNAKLEEKAGSTKGNIKYTYDKFIAPEGIAKKNYKVLIVTSSATHGNRAKKNLYDYHKKMGKPFKLEVEFFPKRNLNDQVTARVA